MRIGISRAAWWGPPKKFNRPSEERRVSWLELFYDLVYVIAIARITHHLSLHLKWDGFLEYVCLFILIFWGWLNGSLYHDLHGNEGLRTRLMTLWQMMIIAALTITLDQVQIKSHVNITVVFMIMQLYITYMWWSVGIYDKEHRRYSKPYMIFYLLALGLMELSLAFPQQWMKLISPLVIICNYTPPFISHRLLRRHSLDLNLTSSMFERLGLFTIIVFGEVVLGVVNGISHVYASNFTTWLNFALALSVVFSLWWIFFTLVSNRSVKKGFARATLLELLYIPTLISLGLIASCLSGLFDELHEVHSLQMVFGYAITTFVSCIGVMMGLLEFPPRFRTIKRPIRISLLITALVFLTLTLIGFRMNSLYYLLITLALIVIEISYVNSLYYGLATEEKTSTENIG